MFGFATKTDVRTPSLLALLACLTSAFTGCPIGFAASTREQMHGGLLLDTAAGLWPDLTAFPVFREIWQETSLLPLKELPGK